MTWLDAARPPLLGAFVLSRRVADRRDRRVTLTWLGWLSGLATLVLAVAGCGGQASVALPGKAASEASPAAVAGAPQTPQGQVVAAYNGYWQALGQALDAQNAANARAILTPYTASALIPSLISGFQTDWARGEIQYGSPVPHVMSVRIAGNRANVHDCADFSSAGVRSASTGQLIGGLGNSRVNMISTLLLTGGRWLVSNQVPVVLPCDP